MSKTCMVQKCARPVIKTPLSLLPNTDNDNRICTYLTKCISYWLFHGLKCLTTTIFNMDTCFSGELKSRFICPKSCGRSYKSKRALNQHLKYECGIEPQFKCFVCLKRFSLKGSLKSHLGLIHNIIHSI